MNDIIISGWKRHLTLFVVILVGILLLYGTFELIKPAQRKVEETSQKLSNAYKDSLDIKNPEAFSKLTVENNVATYEKESYNPIISYGLAIVSVGILFALVGIGFYVLTKFNFTNMLIVGEDGKLNSSEDRGIAIKLIQALLACVTVIISICLYMILK